MAKTKTIYIYKGQDFNNEWELRNAHPELVFPELTHEIMELLGVTTREEPIPEPSPEEVERQKLEEAKRQREEAVRKIKVTVGDKVFDGDEDAQRRMVVAIQTAEIASMDRAMWVLADNTVSEVTLVELKQALSLAAQEMAKLWTKPYQG